MRDQCANHLRLYAICVLAIKCLGIVRRRIYRGEAVRCPLCVAYLRLPNIFLRIRCECFFFCSWFICILLCWCVYHQFECPIQLRTSFVCFQTIPCVCVLSAHKYSHTKPNTHMSSFFGGEGGGSENFQVLATHPTKNQSTENWFFKCDSIWHTFLMCIIA